MANKCHKITEWSKLTTMRPSAKALLIVVVVATAIAAQAKDIIVMRPTIVKLGQSDLDTGVSITAYSYFFKLRCAVVAYATNSTTPVFCITANNTCLVTDATLPPRYDNTEGNPPLHTCYTFIKPLIDREAALAECGGVEENCCPTPFEENAQLGGCVFSSGWYYPIQPHGMARHFCRSMWTTSDFYIKPSTTAPANVIAYVGFASLQPSIYGVWIGGKAISNGSTTYKWVDGTAISSYDFSYGEPNKKSTTPQSGVANCVGIVSTPPMANMVDELCSNPMFYVCQIY